MDTDNKLNKSAFVRSLPADMHAKEVVEKAKAAGMVLSEKHVQVIRYKAKAAPQKSAPAKAPVTSTKNAPQKAASTKAKAIAKKAAPAKPKAPAAPAIAAKKEPRSTMNKAQFIRSLPAGTPAKEVVARAKAVGLALTPAYVYDVRKTSTPKKAAAAAAPAPKKVAVAPKPTTNGAPRAPHVSGGGNETTFRQLIVNLGVERSKALLGDVERKLGELISGR